MFDRIFLAHPRAVGESYGRHFRVALRIGLLLIGSGAAALVHAVLPRFHQRTAGDLIRRLEGELRARSDAPSPKAGLTRN